MESICDTDVPQIVANGNSITCCAVVADGCSIVAGTSCGTLFAYTASQGDSSVGVLTYCKAAHAFSVCCLAENAGSSLVASGGGDAVCIVQPAVNLFRNTSERVVRLRSHTLPISSIRFVPWSPQLVATCGLDGMVFVADVTNGLVLCSLNFGCALSTFSFGVDGASVIAARSGGGAAVSGADDDETATLAIAEIDMFLPARIRQNIFFDTAGVSRHHLQEKRKGGGGANLPIVWKAVEPNILDAVQSRLSISELSVNHTCGSVVARLSRGDVKIVWLHGNVCGQILPADKKEQQDDSTRLRARFSSIATAPQGGQEAAGQLHHHQRHHNDGEKSEASTSSWSLGWSSWWRCSSHPQHEKDDALWLCESAAPLVATSRKKRQREAAAAKIGDSPEAALQHEIIAAEADGKALQSACDELVAKLRAYAAIKKKRPSAGGVTPIQ